MSEKSNAILTVSLIIFFLSGSFLYYGIVQHNRSIDNLIEVSEKDTHYILKGMKSFTFKTYRWKIQDLLNTCPRIIEAFATRKRRLLYELTLPQYEAHHYENKFLDIMHFHLPDDTTFLRVHKPDFFGDNLKVIRPMINAVNRNHNPLSGFEIGRQGPFYRIVQPIFYNDNYIGALEFGISAYQIIDVLESETQIKSAAFFDERVWRKVTIHKGDPIVKTGNFILTSHNTSLTDLLPENFQFGKDDHPVITIDNKTYIVHSHPIFNDFQGKSIGGLVLFQDISQIMEQKSNFIFKFTLLTIGLLAIAIMALYYTFGRIIGSLRQREAKLSSIFRAAPAGIGVVVNREIIEVNMRLCEMMGYTKEELLGKSARMLYPSDEEYELVGREKYRQISTQGTGTVETHWQRKDGILIDVLLSSTPMNLDDLSAGVTFTATDITGIKDTESKLRRSENKFRSMMESMSDPVYICSDDYHVEYMNPAMIKRIERDATGEVCYKALHDFDEPCPWCIGKDETQRKYFETEIVSPKDNRSYNISHSPIINEDGSVSAMIIFRDTTEFKKLETQFHQSQKMEAIGKLAGGVAHDFNNILTVIKGHAQLGMLQTTNENPLWNDLVEIEKAGDRAAKLTLQLLAFSRKQAIKPELVLINYLINDLGKMLKRLVGEDITLKFELGEKLSPILADPGQLEQIIINLVVNAADAIKDLSLRLGRNITISTSEVLLDNDFILSHSGSQLGWHLLLQIADNGCGISNAVLEHIFEPFYTSKEVGKGTGLGLSTVYGIIKQNHACVYVKSEPDQGAVFKIYWPSAKGDTTDIIKNKKLAPTPGGSEVILLVEDEEGTRNIAKRILQQAGYTVIEAENGLDALEKAKDYQSPIDLLFTDIVMPKMGGKELSEKLTATRSKIETLFTSGHLGDRVNRDDQIFSDDRFIDKPYDVPVVLSKIRQLLDNRGEV